MVSLLKQVQVQLLAPGRPQGWHTMVLPLLLALANLAAHLGADLFLASADAAPGAAEDGASTSSSSAGGMSGVNTVWLALSGRGIAVAGAVLACARPWLQDCMRADDASSEVAADCSSERAGDGSAESTRKAALHELVRSVGALSWVAEQLASVQQQQKVAVQQEKGATASSSAAAAVVPVAAAAAASCPPALPTDAAVLCKLHAHAEQILSQLEPLYETCAAGLDDSSTEAAQVAALAAFSEAIGGSSTGEGLPAALQELGEGVWSAFPHRHVGCNDPACTQLSPALTEVSAAKKLCTNCKVRPA